MYIALVLTSIIFVTQKNNYCMQPSFKYVKSDHPNTFLMFLIGMSNNPNETNQPFFNLIFITDFKETTHEENKWIACMTDCSCN